MVIFLGLVREAVKIGSGVCGKEGDKDDSDGSSDESTTDLLVKGISHNWDEEVVKP